MFWLLSSEHAVLSRIHQSGYCVIYSVGLHPMQRQTTIEDIH